MRHKRIAIQTTLFIFIWVMIFLLLNFAKWKMQLVSGPNQNQMKTGVDFFTLKDALIASVPILIWLVVSFPWDKISIGPVSLERRIRRRIEDELIPRDSIVELIPVELSKKEENQKKIKEPTTKAVYVTVGDKNHPERYEELPWFVSGKDNIDWTHVEYVVFIDTSQKLIGTMGPYGFRRKLLDNREEFLNGLRNQDTRKFLDFENEIHIKETATKSDVVRVFSKHPLQWFPVVDDKERFKGIIMPEKIAVTLLGDIAAALFDDQ